MNPLPNDFARCDPARPDYYCTQCRRWLGHSWQTVGELQTYIAPHTGSDSEACQYLPINPHVKKGPTK